MLRRIAIPCAAFAALAGCGRDDGHVADAAGAKAVLERELDRTAAPNPGRPALRRLNRAEYANTIRDLVGLDVDVAALLARGADPNVANAKGETPLALAETRATPEIVAQLRAAVDAR
jgi:beta-lactamase class A